MHIRSLGLPDLSALVVLEQASFTGDKLSRRALRRLLERPTALFVGVSETEGSPLLGYALVLMRAGTSLARLYSIAVNPDARGKGLGRALMAAAEQAALDEGASAIRLEVRPDNAKAITLYDSLGYREFAVHQGYYEDLSDALRMSKPLLPGPRTVPNAVPLYHQTLDFTCGAACLMMAMRALDPDSRWDRTEEIRLWREATTIFMTSGHGGCGPHGLALAAHRRGFDAEVYVSEPGPLFVEGVRDLRKKEVLRVVHADFEAACTEAGIPVHVRALDADELADRFADGAIPIVLISQYRLWREKVPHWVVVSAIDRHCIHVNDPDVDLEEETASSLDCLRLPIPRRDFQAMARYGQSRLRAAVIIRRRP
jgi:ribosomal protein S18 acetylase RimI-like enzyme